jgi:hypothetical protein
MGVANIFTGKLNLCMDCDFYTTLDKGAQEHSRVNFHEVRRQHVQNLEISSESIGKLRKQMKGSSGDN